MTEPIDLTINFKELVNRGLNTKAPDISTLIDKFLKQVIDDKLRGMFPRMNLIPWHFVKIHYSGATENYFVRIAPGWPKQKG